MAGASVRRRLWRQLRSASYLTRPVQPKRPSFCEQDVLYMDNHLLLVNKPAGLLSQSDRTGDADVSALAREYVRVAAKKSGEAFVALVHRLDRPVSGVMCVARTSKAAGRLSASFRTREGGVEKIYHAVVAGELSGSGTRRDLLISPHESGPVARRGRGPRTAVAPTRRRDDGGGVGSGPSEKLAELEWEAVGVSPSAAADLRCSLTGEQRTLVRLRLVTGRKHQIRVQLAEMGHPVVGDTRYGTRWCSARQEPRSGAGGATLSYGAAEMVTMRPTKDRSILLHASELSVPHPTRVGTTVRAMAPPPEAWRDICGRKVMEEVFGRL